MVNHTKKETTYVWLHNPAVPRGQSKKLYCLWVGPFKVVKCLSDSVYRVQDTRSRRKCQVFHFDRLKRCHAPPSELRTDSLSDTQNLAPEVNLRNESDDSEHLTPLGANLELVENDDDDLTINLPAVENLLTTTQPNRRYPVRENRRRPARYRDDGDN